MSVNKTPKLACVIGDPIEHSLSPLIHNAGYEALGIADQFSFKAFPLKAEDLDSGLETLRQLGVVGVSVTLPHKVNCLAFVGSSSIAVQEIGAANTLVRKDATWHAENTDYLGILKPLEKLTTLAGKKVAILGASGAARAAIYAMKIAKAKVKIFNRTASKAEELAEEFGMQAGSWEQLNEVSDYQVIINCTSIGMNQGDLSPVPESALNQNQIVFDCIYNQEATDLLNLAKKQGAKTIHGVEMFIEQAKEQFYLYTNFQIASEVFRTTLNKHFNWKVQ